jgi:hypothetical protein
MDSLEVLFPKIRLPRSILDPGYDTLELTIRYLERYITIEDYLFFIRFWLHDGREH